MYIKQKTLRLNQPRALHEGGTPTWSPQIYTGVSTWLGVRTSRTSETPMLALTDGGFLSMKHGCGEDEDTLPGFEVDGGCWGCWEGLRVQGPGMGLKV